MPDYKEQIWEILSNLKFSDGVSEFAIYDHVLSYDEFMAFYLKTKKDYGLDSKEE